MCMHACTIGFDKQCSTTLEGLSIHVGTLLVLPSKGHDRDKWIVERTASRAYRLFRVSVVLACVLRDMCEVLSSRHLTDVAIRPHSILALRPDSDGDADGSCASPQRRNLSAPPSPSRRGGGRANTAAAPACVWLSSMSLRESGAPGCSVL